MPTGLVGSEMCIRDRANVEIRQVIGRPVAAGLALRGCGIAHIHEARTVYSGLMGRWFFGIPYVITRRVVANQSWSPLRSRAYKDAAQMVAISAAAADKLKVRHPGIEATVIADAHAEFPVNDAAVAEIRAARPGKTLIGHIGALDHSHKGQSTIIEAARIAADTHPDWHFLLCGDGKDESRFRREIGDLENIELVGWVDNVGDYLAAMDLFVYPSLHEALGSSLLDALHAGLPIVASGVGGIPELIEDGVNGRLIEPENPGQLLAATGSLLADADALAGVRARNIEKSNSYDSRRMADAYETLYREIAAQL